MTAAFGCPKCAATVQVGSTACPTCGASLAGLTNTPTPPKAGRLTIVVVVWLVLAALAWIAKWTGVI